MNSLRWFAAALALMLLVAGQSERNNRDAEASSERLAMTDFDVTTASLVSQLTGADSPAHTHEPWNIYGADLGFSFKHQEQLYLVFGDTWGRGGNEADDWRSNTMALAEPHPEHGYVLTGVIADEHGEAKELLSSLKQPGSEYTVIPTAGISVNERIYLHYMSINDWVDSGWGYKHPALNGAGLAYSDDDGHTWTKDAAAFWAGEGPFSQAAMVRHGEHVYMFGTQAGRFGPLRLLRVDAEHLLDPTRYEYWTGTGWRPDPAGAVEVVPAPVGELSVRWSPQHGRWLMMYLNDVSHNIVLRTAERLEGPWDDERVIVTAREYPTLYAPFLLPITGPDIYFTMSLFQPYQVFVMRLDL